MPTTDRPNRCARPAAAATIAATASAGGDPDASGMCGSIPTATANCQNQRRTASARPANRRHQRRTVEIGTPVAAATGRYPVPAALAAKAAHTVAAA